MKRTEVAREVRDELHQAEAAMRLSLENTRSVYQRLVLAKTELGLTGTLGDAAIANAKEALDSQEAAYAALVESHKDAYDVLKQVDIRGVAAGPTFGFGTSTGHAKAA